MKTNFYILIVSLLTVSLGNAQSTGKVENIEVVKTVTVENNDNITNEKDILLIDATELKESIARSSSDIRIYLNRKRKVGNISLVFPKINKAVKG
ncbi:hypothetical protein [Flavisericum labens]|uniref:hypothetical protein n=1 Tax=Flavisericum labens TaxID=3377112 RepID=UPI00387B4B3C